MLDLSCFILSYFDGPLFVKNAMTTSTASNRILRFEVVIFPTVSTNISWHGEIKEKI